eukprot:SAG22_NODE_7083_length_778_cov_2.849779_1_plen_222_part_10
MLSSPAPTRHSWHSRTMAALGGPQREELLILYGSQTGTAQDVAEEAARQAERYWIDARALPMDAVGPAALPGQRLLVLIMSTTGQGETPDNMKRTYKGLLRKSLPADFLGGVSFAIFGLGDSNYEKFNAVSRRLWVRLQQLGAVPLLPEPGLGDDQAALGYDEALEPWLAKLWNRLLEPDALPLPAGKAVLDDGHLATPRLAISAEVPGPGTAAGGGGGGGG